MRGGGVSKSSFTGVGEPFVGKKNYLINLSSSTESINKGLFGVHISGMFKTNALYQDTNSTDQWQWMVDLQPRSLRFPSGSNGKLAHLLSGPAGYGLNLEEIIRVHDASDGVIDLDATEIANLIDDIHAYCQGGEFADGLGAGGDGENPDHAGCDFEANQDLFFTGLDSWMDVESKADDSYIDDVKEYVLQTFLDESDSNDLFINQFIDLIDQIQTTHGYTVDVIYCANILSEPASEVRAIIDYLRTNGVNVVGVELGNEVTNEFFCNTIGFKTFADYWNYIHGTAMPAYTVTTDLYTTDPLTNPLYAVTADHDYFAYLKEDPTFNIKIGLPAQRITTGEFVFKLSESLACGDPNWNTSLRSNYFAMEGVTGLNRRYFDAIVLHPYYDNAGHWSKSFVDPVTGLEEEYICGTFIDGIEVTEWDYTSPDPFLEPVFEDVTLHWRRFIKDSIDLAYQEFNTYFDFDLTGSEKKELWTTEWNIKIKPYDDLFSGLSSDGKREQTVTNNFPHGFLVQEWWLKNLRLNFDPAYKKNFFKYSTIQNYASGSDIQLLSPADKPDEFTYYGIMDPVYQSSGMCRPDRNYYVKRTTMFSYELLSQINKNNLAYLETAQGTFSTNINLPPTTFIDAANQVLYVYYSNIKQVEQKYTLTSTFSLLGLYPWGYYVTIDHPNAKAYVVQAQQLYSGSGKSMLFNDQFNTCYATTNYTPEITAITVIDNASPVNLDCADPLTNPNCFNVPPLSYGYIEIPFEVSDTPSEERKAQLIQHDVRIIPNPAMGSVQFDIGYATRATILIYNGQGILIDQLYLEGSKQTDISTYSAGVYTVKVICTDGEVFTEKLVVL